MTIEVKVPDIGDFDAVPVIEIQVAVGDTIEAEQGLITLETDKASMDIPAPQAGIVKALHVKVGDKIAQGAVILELESADTASQPSESIAKEGVKAEVATEQRQVEIQPAATSNAVVSQTQAQPLIVPDLGTQDAVPIIELAVQVGEHVEAEQALITLESDKASMDIPAPVAGVVKSIVVKVGDKLKTGDQFGELEIQVTDVSVQEKATTQTTTQPASKPTTQTSVAEAKLEKSTVQTNHAYNSETGKLAYAGPAVRRMARELGVDLAAVKGSGLKGRITPKDIQQYVKAKLQAPASGTGLGLNIAELPKVDFAAFGEIDKQPLPRIKKLSGGYLHRNWVHIPHVTQFDEADITEMEAFRKNQKELALKQGVKLTPLVFLMKAVVAGLKHFPIFNSSLDPDGQHVIYKKYFHIGVAVDTPNGLVVPVVRDVDQKGLFQLAKELGEISQKARDGKLQAKDMQGGCFSISSLGGIGGTAFTPIVNLPDVAILGVSKSQMKPIYSQGEFQPRLMLPLSLSYDHRVIDGADAARFTRLLVEQLSDIRRLLL